MDKNAENRLEKLAETGSVGICIIMLGLLIGTILTYFAGGWEVMKHSVFWLSAFWLNVSAMFGGLAITLITAAKFNKLYC